MQPAAQKTRRFGCTIAQHSRTSGHSQHTLDPSIVSPSAQIPLCRKSCQLLVMDHGSFGISLLARKSDEGLGKEGDSLVSLGR